MSKDDQERALEFMSSWRGQYIVGQALAVAIRQLESVEPEVLQEKSNIADMKFLLEHLFPIGQIAILTNANLKETVN